MKALNNKRINDGKCLINGLPTLKWKTCAPIIKSPIPIAGIRTKDECQIPTISKAESDVFDAPTAFLVRSLNPNCLNSVITLWYLKIHTKYTDIATAIWHNCVIYSIVIIKI